MVLRYLQMDVFAARPGMGNALGAVIGDFVGRPITLHRQNVGARKSEADQYRAARDHLRIPADILDAIYADPLMTYFFEKADLDALSARWSNSGA